MMMNHTPDNSSSTHYAFKLGMRLFQNPAHLSRTLSLRNAGTDELIAVADEISGEEIVVLRPWLMQTNCLNQHLPNDLFAAYHCLQYRRCSVVVRRAAARRYTDFVG
jgi:hypothetical protein